MCLCDPLLTQLSSRSISRQTKTRYGLDHAGSVAFIYNRMTGHELSVVVIATIVAGWAGNAFFFLRTWQQAFALSLLACSLAGTANGFCFFTDTALGWLFESLARLHFAEETFPLHLLLQNPKGLFNIVITDENLQSFSLPMLVSPCGRK
jgi:hypothetical protein